MEVRPQVTMMSAEAFVYYVSRRWQQEFGKVKVWFDCSLVMHEDLTNFCFNDEEALSLHI